MCGSGVRIGMANTVVLLRLILQVLMVGLSACSVVVAGAAMLGAVARRAVTAARLASAAAALGFDWSSPSNDFLFRVVHSYYNSF